MQDRYLRLIAHCLVLVVIMLGLIAAGLWFRLDQVDSKAQGRSSSRSKPPMRTSALSVPSRWSRWKR